MKKSKFPDPFKARFHKVVQNILWVSILAEKATSLYSEVFSACDTNDFYFYGAFLMIYTEWTFNHIMYPLLTPRVFYSERVQCFLLLTTTESPASWAYQICYSLAVVGFIWPVATSWDIHQKYDEHVLVCWHKDYSCTGGPWVCSVHTRSGLQK